jgi:hypothetical protein
MKRILHHSISQSDEMYSPQFKPLNMNAKHRHSLNRRITFKLCSIKSNNSIEFAQFNNKSPQYKPTCLSAFSKQLLNNILPETKSVEQTCGTEKKERIVNLPCIYYHRRCVTENKLNCNNNCNSNSNISCNYDKRYEKKCNLTKHIISKKFISNFLSPINNFISADFKLKNEEYNHITKDLPVVKKKNKLFIPLPPKDQNNQPKELNMKKYKFKFNL